MPSLRHLAFVTAASTATLLSGLLSAHAMPAIGAANVQALAIDQHVRDAAAAPAHFGGAERFEIDQRGIAKRQSGGRQQGVYLKTWSGGWTWQGIQDMFTSLYGQTDVIFVTFFQTVATGLDCPAQSPCTPVYSQQAGANVPASEAYKAAISAAAGKGIKTMLALGGWSYRDDFAFLAGMSADQLQAWAQAVKKVVDDFGAHGIDIDYEAQTKEQWERELVQTNVIGYLRQAMPAGQYSIYLTVGGIAAAAGTPEEVQNAFSPPLSQAYPLTGVALSTIQKNMNDIDYLQLMTYDGEANFDPRVCMALTSKALQAMGATGANSRILVGAELGEQFGACQGVSDGWCLQDTADVTAMAEDVIKNGYGGIFYWPNVDSAAAAQFYASTYATMKQ